MEEEAEDRAQKRFKHFAEVSGTFSLPNPSLGVPVPTRQLLVGPASEFRQYTTQLVGNDERSKFLMLVELMRAAIFEGWDREEVRAP